MCETCVLQNHCQKSKMHTEYTFRSGSKLIICHRRHKIERIEPEMRVWQAEVIVCK